MESTYRCAAAIPDTSKLPHSHTELHGDRILTVPGYGREDVDNVGLLNSEERTPPE